jgi:SNF2 family DNA or RNA helicase
MTPEFFKKYEDALVVNRDFGDAPNVFYSGFRRAVNAVGTYQEEDDDEQEQKMKKVQEIEKAIGTEEYLNQKLDVLLQIVNNGRQTLVFTNWIAAGVSILENAFKENYVAYSIISGQVPANTRFDIVRKFNRGDVQVLIITLAGSEGLDLKKVRDVIILDPVWNPAVLEQIIGRAVRLNSHKDLPEKDRQVDVHNLILKTPERSVIPSGDEILYGFISRKHKELEKVIKMLRNASI